MFEGFSKLQAIQFFKTAIFLRRTDYLIQKPLGYVSWTGVVLVQLELAWLNSLWKFLPVAKDLATEIVQKSIEAIEHLIMYQHINSSTKWFQYSEKWIWLSVEHFIIGRPVAKEQLHKTQPRTHWILLWYRNGVCYISASYPFTWLYCRFSFSITYSPSFTSR